MFKLSEAGMPEDPSYPRDLSQLGYFIDERSEIRTIKPPHYYYNFWLSNNDRVNEAFRESMHACINDEVARRMTALGMPPLYLPQQTSEKPHGEPNVPIFVTKKEDMSKQKRITVVINEDCQDLGLLAYRIVSKELGLEAGSVVSLAKALVSCEPTEVPALPTQGSAENEKHDLKESLISKPGAQNGPELPIASKTPVTSTESVPFKVPENWQAPGLVVLNPGQLVYSYHLDKAVSNQSWDSQPRKSAVHPVPKIHPVHNRINGHSTVAEHIKSTFETILNNPNWVAPDAKFDMIGIGNGGNALLQVLNEEWPKYEHRVAAIALTDPTPIQEVFTNQKFVNFLRDRARALVPSSEPFSTPLAVPSTTSSPLPAHSSDWGFHYYPILSSGERVFGEIILPIACRAVLAWFDAVAAAANYRNPEFRVPEVPEGVQVFDATEEDKE
ncbi:hypothetical protein DBV05_g1023 [Lasiodiplodia theobromae]|uniref:Arb2 domain-containing protein n=1 Tax=Lasiodiplodia theobromae TaxID=45133 RepID=A0A5N5DRW0_9PEZI|nr:hypothetical protein DBV05_g1023 [Lasiodiplodia theobromae]